MFIVPCAAAIAPSAPNSASVITWLVSTLPATTAAGARGCSIEPSGTTSLQRAQAPFVHRHGIVDQRAHDIQHRRAHHRQRRIEIVGQLRRGAGEVDSGFAGVPVDRDGDMDFRAVVHRCHEAAIAEPAEQRAHGILGLLLDMAHIGIDRRPPLFARNPAQFGRPLGAGGDLRLEVRDILVGIARRPRPGAQQRTHVRFEQLPPAHQQHIVEQDAFLIHRCAIRRHRARSDPADIGMMAARGDKPGRLRISFRRKDRHHHGDVRQMRAAFIRRIECVDVASQDAPPVTRAAADDRAHAFTHRAEMDRHMRRIGDEIAVRGRRSRRRNRAARGY